MTWYMLRIKRTYLMADAGEQCATAQAAQTPPFSLQGGAEECGCSAFPTCLAFLLFSLVSGLVEDTSRRKFER